SRACPASGTSSPSPLPKTVGRPSEWVRRSDRLLHPYPSPSASAPEGHSAGVFEFCSGLVDLIAGVGHHGGGGHRFTLAGQRFVGLVAEDTGGGGDGGGDSGAPRCGDGTEREPGDGGRRFIASEPVEKNGEEGQRDADHGGVARIVE